MNALTCGLLAFGFILQFCFCEILAEQKTEGQEERENACPNSGATFYYILNERIYSKHYDFIKNQGVFINTELSSIRAIAYDYKHNESLAVDNEKPDTVWGFSRNMLSHSVVQLENASFDFIAADPTTGNIYFADNNQSIGVCSGHSVNTSCTLLIPKSLNKRMDYKDLVLYYQRGILFWIEGGVGISIVKMASMSGKHIRELDIRYAVKGIALDSRKDSLYILRGGYIKKYVIHKHASVSEYYVGNAINQIFTMSCGDVFLFKNQTETLGYFKLFTEKLELVKLDKSVQGSKVSRVVSVLVHDNDKSPKPNPCKNFQCNGICVITEAFPDPVAECVPITYSQPKQVGKVEAQTESNPLNALLLVMVILLALILGVLLTLVFYPALRFGLRDRIYRIFGKQPPTNFANAPKSGSIVSVATNEI